LPHQPLPRSAERQPYRKFTLPRCGARKQQIRQVQTSDEQNDEGDAS
jgi:hypothetical protein